MNCTQSLSSSTSIYHPIYTLSHMHAINCRYFLSSGRIYNQPCYIQSYRRVDVDRNTDLQPNPNSDEDHTDWSIKFICSIPQPGGTTNIHHTSASVSSSTNLHHHALLIPSTFKASSYRPTPWCSNIWRLRIHLHFT